MNKSINESIKSSQSIHQSANWWENQWKNQSINQQKNQSKTKSITKGINHSTDQPSQSIRWSETQSITQPKNQSTSWLNLHCLPAAVVDTRLVRQSIAENQRVVTSGRYVPDWQTSKHLRQFTLRLFYKLATVLYNKKLVRYFQTPEFVR